MEALLILFLGSSLLLVALAVPMLLGKVPPNPYYGFRVPATFKDEQVWYAANRYAARWLLASGLAEALAAIILYFVPGISEDAYALAVLGVFGLVFVPGLVFSFRYLADIKS